MLRSAQGGLLLAGLLLACNGDPPIPGENLGRFEFTAAPQTIGCPFQEIPDGGFKFDATLSVVEGGPAYLTFNVDNDNIRRQGTFDGRRFEFTYPGPTDDPVVRTFEIAPDAGACGDRFLVEETLRAVFLTDAEFGLVKDVDGGCPSDPEALFDAGGPTDAGILPPSRGPDGGFDAQVACGVLIENVRPETQCDFPACTLTYRIDGARKTTP